MEPYTLILLCILVMAYILIRLENRRDSRNGKKALPQQGFFSVAGVPAVLQADQNVGHN